MPVKYVIDLEKSVVLNNFGKRSWQPSCLDQPWNLYWASASSVKDLFSSSGYSGYRLQDDQLVNHFPNHQELTRKDLMVKNFKRYRKELERERHPLAAKDENQPGTYLYLEILPTTYMMPADYKLFVSDFKKSPSNTWIMKPCGRARGKGIFLVSRLSHVQRWMRNLKVSSLVQTVAPRDMYVISRYIDQPLLIGGKKFDIRLYVLITSFRPLVAYLYRQGFCRFCSLRYSKSPSSMGNPLAHLTNISIQKSSQEYYNTCHGNKWSLSNLFLYLTCCYGTDRTQRLMDDVRFCVYQSLCSVAPIMRSDKHCFELYGYDIIVDATLKPWLIEINASPSLTATTTSDRVLKTKLVDDLLNIVIPNNNVAPLSNQSKQTKYLPKEFLGDFEILTEESVNISVKR